MSPSPVPIGILVVTHGHLADELVEAARVIVGANTTHLSSLSIGWNDPLDAARERIRTALAAADRGRGVLVLTDMFGGTPTNLCLSFLAPDVVEIVTGVNLPMVVKCASLGSDAAAGASLRSVAQVVAARGAESVVVPAGILEPAGGRPPGPGNPGGRPSRD